jgi:hypothetical protein
MTLHADGGVQRRFSTPRCLRIARVRSAKDKSMSGRLFASSFLLAVLAGASPAAAFQDPFDPSGTGTFPIVYGPTGRPYGPTQAYYQYEQEYGRQWDGIGGAPLPAGYNGGQITVPGTLAAVGTFGPGWIPGGFVGPIVWGGGWGGWGGGLGVPMAGWGYRRAGFGLPFLGGFGGTTTYGWAGWTGAMPYGPSGLPGSPFVPGSFASPSAIPYGRDPSLLYPPGYPAQLYSVPLNPHRTEPVVTVVGPNAARYTVADPRREVVDIPVRVSSLESKRRSLRLRKLGDEAFAESNFVRAYNYYRQAALEAQDQAEPRANMGYALAALNKGSLAATELKRAVSIDPEWPTKARRLDELFGKDPVVGKGAFFARLQDWVKEDIRDPDRLFVIGVMLVVDDQEEKAATFLQAADMLGDSPKHVRAFLGPLREKFPGLNPTAPKPVDDGVAPSPAPADGADLDGAAEEPQAEFGPRGAIGPVLPNAPSRAGRRRPSSDVPGLVGPLPPDRK